MSEQPTTKGGKKAAGGIHAAAAAKEAELMKAQVAVGARRAGPKKQKLVAYGPLPYPVKVNGRWFRQTGRCTPETREVLNHAAHAKQMRRLRELIRHEYEVHEIAPGVIGQRLVKVEGDSAGVSAKGIE